MSYSQITFFLILICSIVGCSWQDAGRMSITEEVAQFSTQKTIRVNPVRGEEALDDDILKLDMDEFKQALDISLEASGLFSTVTPNDSDYVLDTEIILQSFQTSGVSFTSILEVNYKVTEISPTAAHVIMDKDITTACKKTGGDNFAFHVRRTRSVECSVSENIKGFLKKLTKELKER